MVNYHVNELDLDPNVDHGPWTLPNGDADIEGYEEALNNHAYWAHVAEMEAP